MTYPLKGKIMNSERKIVITNCVGCPYGSHAGAFAAVAYVPTCKAARMERPYRTEVRGGRVTAIPNMEIPDWCPLPKNEVGVVQ